MSIALTSLGFNTLMEPLDLRPLTCQTTLLKESNWTELMVIPQMPSSDAFRSPEWGPWTFNVLAPGYVTAESATARGIPGALKTIKRVLHTREMYHNCHSGVSASP